ncbi:type 12 methyltransferase [Clostridium bornimense]|uniref:Type 12 methyltransferase n=1 Tax=Clostridium bornimense TaxID=1216932 RepID=W6S6Z9_9CLOT|nr:class I SAM-dependent methyltransferase [Clostridium bornimense]CDM70187.1 type 12 methyltransferase [Clostridium bornimense]
MYFDYVAKEWDTPRRIERAKIISKEISRSIDNIEIKSAMEFGCGTGLISLNLVNKFKNITLIDNSEEMIQIVNKKISECDFQNIKSICDNITDMKINDTYDVIYSSMSLHHIVNVKKVLNKLYYSLNSDGVLCIVDLNEENGRFHKNEEDFNGHNGFNQQWLKEVVEEVGFKSVKSRTFYNGRKNIDGEEVPYSLFILSALKEDRGYLIEV